MKRYLPTFVLLAVMGLWTGIGFLYAQNTPHSVSLSWSPDTTATGGFNVYRATVSGGPYTKIGTVGAGVLAYVDATAVGGTTYYYAVTALDTATPPDESSYSTQASATAIANPQTPSGLVVVSK